MARKRRRFTAEFKGRVALEVQTLIGRGFVRQNLPELADKWNKSGHYATIVFLTNIDM